LERVYTKFKDIDDELQRQGDDRLFLKEMDSAHQRALRLVDAGLLSDPANFDMYFYTRTVNGCPEYITCRGTSQLENYWRIQERQATYKKRRLVTLNQVIIGLAGFLLRQIVAPRRSSLH
jgi:hypothetical protein